MAIDFDEFPIYDPIIKSGTQNLSAIWTNFIATFYMNLISYLSSGGIFVPQVTTAQRSTLQNIQNGQMIYNTTVQAPQIFQNGVWKTFTTT